MASAKLRLLCIRHGQTDWNLEGRYCGQADIPLNDTGVAAAERLAEELKSVPIEAIYSSDLIRAYDTARIIARHHELDIKIDPRLKELDQGEWEGMLFGDIKAKYSELFNRRDEAPFHFSPPDGESVEEVKARVIPAVEDIRNRHPEGGTVAVVAHGFTLALVRVHYANIDIKHVWEFVPPNTEVIEIVL